MKKFISSILIIACLAAAAYSGFQLYKMFNGYYADRSTYKKVQEVGKDFDKLRKINEDVIGWLTLEDTIIDYPVVQSHDNKEYLSLKFDKTWGGAGTLFADCGTNIPFVDRNTIIYGHHMRDGSMFHDLQRFSDIEYAKKHPVFKLYTPENDYDAVVYAFLSIEQDSDIYTPDADETYVDLVNKLAKYRIGEIDENSKLLVLSTCAYAYEGNRHVVVCELKPHV